MVRVIVTDKERIVFPRRWKSKNRAGVDFGFMGSVVVGFIVGLIVDTHPITSFAAAIGGPELIEQAIKTASKNPSSIVRRFLG